MLGVGAQVISGGYSKGAVVNSSRSGAAADTCTGAPEKFRAQFAADSAESGAVRTLKEQQLRAARCFAEADFEEALVAYEQMAHSAKEMDDRASEAIAVVGLADCLANANAETADVELICGMYRYAGDAAEEVGDADTRFAALIGCAKIRWSCCMFERSVKLWEAAVALAATTGNVEHCALAKSELAKALLYDHLEVVDENKDVIGHVSKDDDASHLRSGASSKEEKALKLLQEVVAELPDSASTDLQVSARMNLAWLYRTRKATTQSKRKAESELILALDCVVAHGGDPKTRKMIEAYILELYEENLWLVDGRPEAQQRLTALQANRASQPSVEQAISAMRADVGKPTDPDARYMHERAIWANQRLEAIRNGNEDDDNDSDTDAKASMPAFPKHDGWQR
jgi:tetratricopeptide (TPR) repeat protein